MGKYLVVKEKVCIFAYRNPARGFREKQLIVKL